MGLKIERTSQFLRWVVTNVRVDSHDFDALVQGWGLARALLPDPAILRVRFR